MMTDIYTNTTPWGLLDDATRMAFRRHILGSGPLYVWTADGWVRDDSVEWDNGTVYRAVRPQQVVPEPEPVVMTEARKAQADRLAAARDARRDATRAHTFTAYAMLDIAGLLSGSDQASPAIFKLERALEALRKLQAAETMAEREDTAR